LEILEEQIDGLLRRDILLNGGQGHSGSYYSSLGDKEKTIIQLQNQKAYSDIKIQRLRTRLDSLEREVNSLRSALVQTQKISE
jgi:TolA-binding protein